jgi:hypothetical protein
MMQRTLDIETGGRLQEIHARVCSDINCSQCGYTMDTFKTVLVTVRNTKANDDLGSFVICGACWDKQGEGMEAITSDFISHVTTDFRDYGADFQLKKNNPPVKPRKPKPRANIRLGATPNKLESVEYSKRFEASGFIWFIHGEKRDWTISSWECGLKLGWSETQKAGITRAESLTPGEIKTIQGAISLHGGANPPVKKGSK